MHSKADVDGARKCGNKKSRWQGGKCCVAVCYHTTPREAIKTHSHLQSLQQQPEFCFDYICTAFHSFLVPLLADVPLHTLCMEDPPEDLPGEAQKNRVSQQLWINDVQTFPWPFQRHIWNYMFLFPALSSAIFSQAQALRNIFFKYKKRICGCNTEKRQGKI